MRHDKNTSLRFFILAILYFFLTITMPLSTHLPEGFRVLFILGLTFGVYLPVGAWLLKGILDEDGK